MQAIILAAGMGKRLKELTEDNTKCMVRVNGVPLIDRTLGQLEKRGLNRIVVVVGYCGDKLIEHINSLGLSTPVEYVRNDIYNKTNNIYSLWLAHNQLCEDDTLLLESDLIFEESVLDLLTDDPRPNLALVDKYESWMDGTCVKTCDEGYILDFISGKNFNFSDTKDYFKTVNIYKFSKEFSIHQYVPFLKAYCEALGNNEYYEQVLKVIAMLDRSMIQTKKLTGQKWYEIDDAQDLDIAQSLFPAENQSRSELIGPRYGGYWRYPGMLDFCYLVNPYYPPKKLISEMENSFETLLRQYPSGLRVNRILAAKNFEVRFPNITVGNGAAELINALMSEISGKIGIIRPTFEEYPNRYDGEIVTFTPDNFTYTADDVMDFFGGKTELAAAAAESATRCRRPKAAGDKGISTLFLINPDNPSGNYIPTKDVKRLVSWAAEKGIKLVVDESFSDFADENDHTLLNADYIEKNPHLTVIKSISKSHGVPGLRLGIAASGDTELIDRLCAKISIWNINSFAEFYMQIFEKYRKDYERSLELLRAERKRLFDRLSKIDGIEPIPSQANFIMAEITGKISAAELVEKMLAENVLIKDLSGKINNGRKYIRVAVRNARENDIMLEALKKSLPN